MTGPIDEVVNDGRTPQRVGRFLWLGGTAVLAVHLVGLASGTANQVLLARLLAPDRLAAYFLALSVVEVAAHLAHLGLPRPLTRLLAEARNRGRLDEVRGLLASAWPVWIAASLIVVAVYSAGFGSWLAQRVFASESMASVTVLIGLWIAFQGSADLWAGALRGLRRVGLASWVAGTQARVVLAVALGIIFWTQREPSFLLVIALAVAAAASGPALAMIVLRSALDRGTAVRVAPRVLLGAGFPLLIAGVVSMGYERSDLWTIGVLLDADQVALYGAVKRLIVLVSLPIVILSLVVLPIVAEFNEGGDARRLERMLRGAATLAGLPAIAALLILIVAGASVLGLVYGEFYRQGSTVLGLLCLERLFFVWMGPSGMVLAMTGHERALMAITLCAAVVTVASVVAGGSWYGLHGVAIGYLVGSSTQQVASWTAARRLAGLRTDLDPLNLSAAIEALRRAARRSRSS